MVAEEYKKLLDEEKSNVRNDIHSFHRYFGKFIPAIPAFAIKTFTNEGDTILDTFCGSGTSLVEAKFNNRNAIGFDVNPLAIMASRVKTTPIDTEVLEKTFKRLLEDIESDGDDDYEDPYCVNIDHWFRPEVKKDLLRIRKHILLIDDQTIRDFYLMVFSAFMRNVSNCDPRHVFPGYSKRLRALDAEGKRQIHVMSSYNNAVKKRIKQIGTIPNNSSTITLYNQSSKVLPKEIGDISLVVINPPYISSIRYLETMKIEMGWLGLINSQKDYIDLDKTLIGTERYYKKDLEQIECSVKIPELQEQISNLKRTNPKMAKVVAEYFNDIQIDFSNYVKVLKSGGHVVIKISDSKVRTEQIPTHEYFIKILEQQGLKFICKFKDDFDPNSRSLLTARNSYSGIMTFDWILIFEKP
ncbi:hypothetical protein IKG41_03395 [Candidatus Saccharibacteria bacterium]|nr:hypothetical protein [Candidatus Saccharibacteria bacterium]